MTSTSGSRCSRDDCKLSDASSRTSKDLSLSTRLQKDIPSSCPEKPVNDCAFARQVPFSNMIDLIQNHSCCNEDIPADKRKQAYNAFNDVTGYKALDLTQVFNIIHNETQTLVHYNGLYGFIILFIIFLLLILLGVGIGLISWMVALFLIGTIFIILYTFSLIYRIQVSSFTNSQHQDIQQHATTSQNNFQNSIAYWPQGLFAVAAAVTSHGCTGWTCNECDSCLTSEISCTGDFQTSDCEFKLQSPIDEVFDSNGPTEAPKNDLSESEYKSEPKKKRRNRMRYRFNN